MVAPQPDLAAEPAPASGDPLTDVAPEALTEVAAAASVPQTATSAARVPGVHDPIAAGTPAAHHFDVVIAHMYVSPDEYPAGAPAETVDHATVDQWLSRTADWWSRPTGLAFDFSQDTTYAPAIDDTCDAYQTMMDAVAPSDFVTDGDGIVSASLDWDRALPPPSDTTSGEVFVSASDVDASVITLPVTVIAPGAPVVGWFDDNADGVVDVTDTTTLHVRVWDDEGQIVVDRPDFMRVVFSGDHEMGQAGWFTEPDVVGTPVWYAAAQDYTIVLSVVNLDTTDMGRVEVWVRDDAGGLFVAYLSPQVILHGTPAPPARLVEH
jgi:hypothetical protein